MRAFRRGLAALLCAVTTAALAAVPAVGEQPDPAAGSAPAVLQGAALGGSSAVDLLPGVTNVDTVRIADDAVYIVTGGASPTLWRRPLVTGPAGTYVGAPTAIADVDIPSQVTGQSVAENDGTLAYARASDGRLVLRAPNGTETFPAWAPVPFDQGITGLSAHWITTRTSSGSSEHVLNLGSGVEATLDAATPMPAGYNALRLVMAAASDTKVLWTMTALSSTTWFNGAFATSLSTTSPDGLVEGSARTIIATTAAEGGVPLHEPVGIAGDTVAWLAQDCTSDCTTNLRWYRATPYSGTPVQVRGVLGALDMDGTIVAALTTPSTVAWYDVATTSTTPLRTIELPGEARAANARFVVYRDSVSNSYRLADGTGAVVSDKPLPTDIRAGDAFFDDILWLVGRGITGGYSDGTFRPAASVNRDAMAAFLYRMSHDGAKAPACTTAAFTDVPASYPFCGEIAWLASTGVTTGYPDGTFRPGQAVTREAMAAFLYRFSHSGARAPSCVSAPFTDVAASHPFCGEIAWMASAGISTGWSDHTFRPGLTIERQAMAAFLHRYATTDR